MTYSLLLTPGVNYSTNASSITPVEITGRVATAACEISGYKSPVISIKNKAWGLNSRLILVYGGLFSLLGIDIPGYCQSGCRHIVSYGGLAQTSVVVYCTIESKSPNSITPYITFNGLTDDAELGPFRLKTSQNGVFIWGGSHTSRPNQRLQMVGEKSPSGGFVPFDGITPWKLNRYQQGNIWFRHINSEDGRKISAAPYTASAAWTLYVN